MRSSSLVVLLCVLLVSAYRGLGLQQGVRRGATAAKRRDNVRVSLTPQEPPSLSRQVATAALAVALACLPGSVQARPEGVNRPDLLPSGPTTPLIDTANFLTKGQEKKVVEKLNKLEAATGFKLRVLCQSYPETPGLAIKDYWKVDGNTVVLVADKGEGFNRKGIPSNIINLNIGANVELVLPTQFWTRLTNKLGNQPYVKSVGADAAVINTVEAITFCLEDKSCTDVPFETGVSQF